MTLFFYFLELLEILKQVVFDDEADLFVLSRVIDKLFLILVDHFL